MTAAMEEGDWKAKVSEYIGADETAWHKKLEKYPSLKKMGELGPDAKFVRTS